MSIVRKKNRRSGVIIGDLKYIEKTERYIKGLKAPL